MSAAVPPVILVVEDDPQLRRLYREALILDGGFAVVAVEDGLDALRYMDNETPAAVVLDLGLPRVSGRDVQHEMAANARTQQIPIIVVTGDARGVDPSEFACVLAKPVDAVALVKAVRRCLSDRQLPTA